MAENKRDFRSLKLKEEKILPELEEPTEQFSQPQRRGRPRLDPDEKDSKPLQISIKPSEYERIQEKAGLTPVSTYMKHYLRTKTDIFE